MSNHPHLRPNGAEPKQIPVTVPPAPVPVQFIVEQAAGPAGPLVILRMLTPVGTAVYFLPVDGAKTLGQMILDRATPVSLP
jgi:hypothetical protein